MKRDADHKISAAKTALLLNHPFFGAIALSTRFEEKDAAQMLFATMETDGRTIWWCREFVDSLTHDELVGVITHEVMHVALKHSLRIGLRDGSKWNAACDYVINPSLTGWGFTLPEGGLMDLKYKDRNAEEVYNMLPDMPPKQCPWGGVVEPKGADGKSPATATEKASMEMEIDQIVATATTMAKSRGDMPAGMDDMITKAQPPQVDWTERMRRVIGGDQPDDYSYRKMNRKMYHTYRAVAPGVVKAGAGHVVVGIDTSGSVSKRELSHFLGELNAICEETCPHRVTVIQCDARVQRVDEYEQGEIIDTLPVKGRGGTCVTPVFRYIEEQGIEPDSFVYFSDMEVGDFPKNPPRYPVLWVNSTGNGGCNPPWGEVARLWRTG